jgi:hypothetical protein
MQYSATCPPIFFAVWPPPIAVYMRTVRISFFFLLHGLPFASLFKILFPGRGSTRETIYTDTVPALAAQVNNTEC